MVIKKMSLSLYRRRLTIVLVFGIIVGIAISALFVVGCSIARDPRAAENGTTVLLRQDGIVRVPKGALIEGRAVEVIDLDGRIVIKDLDTPFTTTKSMTIRAGSEYSACVISIPKRNGTEYYRQQLVDKILK